jgi:hypothetical protein
MAHSPLRLSLPALLLACAGTLSSLGAAEQYRVEDIAFPPEVAAEVGGIDFDTNGLMYVALRRGDVLTARPAADPAGFAWKVFATGFDNGLGIKVLAPGRIIVSQMPELTEATDTDGDGEADRYRTLSDAWGLSGNYHETTALAPDGAGGFFIGLGTASHRSPTFVYTRGEYSSVGRRGRNYSALQYRGWVMHLKADGTTEPYASGFRVPNGLLRDDEGNLWASDNQGDWKATSPLYHVQQGRFYGHPSSLVWDPKWPAGSDPLATYRADLDRYNRDRTYAAVEIPYERMVRSGSQPIQVPRQSNFGPFGGQILLPDASGTRIARLMVEKVDGEYQGAATLLLDGHGLRISNNRVAFSPDGRSLYVGQTARGWGASKGTNTEGMQRITYLGGAPFTVERMAITPRGFRLTYTQPVGAAATSPQTYALKSYTYQSKWVYGGEQLDIRTESVTSVTAIDDRTVDLVIDSFRPRRVYQVTIAESLQGAGGEKMQCREFHYTANRLPAAQ